MKMVNGNLMFLLTESSSEIVTQEFADHCSGSYQMDHNGFHGFDHWMRVLSNGRLLANLEQANIKVVELFSLIHDTQRKNEHIDPLHGRRAATFAGSLRDVWFKISDNEMNLLIEALTYHSDGYTEGDITVQVCWDADRLDLGRVGIKPAPRRLCTKSAKTDDILKPAYLRSLSK